MHQEYFEENYSDTTRFEEIAQIVQFVKKGASCQLVGVAGAGRSTLLSLLANNRKIRAKHLAEEQRRFHFVMANFSEIRKRSLFDVMKFLFLNLTESLRERKMIDENKAVGDIFREHLKFQDELILFQGFKEAVEYLALQRRVAIVFLFDRFEEYIPTVTADFFANLRILRNKAKYKFSVVFSLYRPLEEFLEPSLLVDYYEFVAGNVIYLPLVDETTTKFRIAYIEKITGKKVDPEILKQVITLTGGAGRLIKLSIEAILGNKETYKNLSEFLLKQKIVKTALFEMWSVLTQAEQADLISGKFEDPEIDDYLEKVGLVKNKKIQIPLFYTFIHEQFDNEQSEDAQIIYDQNTNAIHKGVDIISDQLTASEFRMLRYLLQNPDKVVERDELVGVVWSENKSTAGITDQAVDQLVFRLRRKIEEDPNNPKHLFTVKGRGFRFVA